MGKIAGTKTKRGKHLFLYILTLIVFPVCSFTFIQEQYIRQEPEIKKAGSNIQTIAYKSAFRSLETVPRNKLELPPGEIHYTIQICSLTVLVNDPFLNGRYKIKVVRMGELYRYIFSSYTTLDHARKELTEVQKIFPKAFIREYNGSKLGKAIDLNI